MVWCLSRSGVGTVLFAMCNNTQFFRNFPVFIVKYLIKCYNVANRFPESVLL